MVLWFCFANLGAFDLSPAYRHPFCVCYLPPSGEVLFDAFIPVLLAKFRGEETFAFVFVAALFAFVTNAPAFVPLFDEPPTKRTRKSKHLLKSNPSYIIGRAKILKTRHTGKETPKIKKIDPPYGGITKYYPAVSYVYRYVKISKNARFFSFSSYSLIVGSSSKKQRGEETHACVGVAALPAFVTNAPAPVPWYDEPPTKRTRKPGLLGVV